MKGVFVLFIIEVISDINKIIYFSANIFEGRKFYGTERSTGLGGAVRYGVRFELDGTERSAVQVFCAVLFRVHIFRPESLSTKHARSRD